MSIQDQNNPKDDDKLQDQKNQQKVDSQASEDEQYGTKQTTGQVRDGEDMNLEQKEANLYSPKNQNENLDLLNKKPGENDEDFEDEDNESREN